MLAGNESSLLKVLPWGPNFKPNFTAPHRNKSSSVFQVFFLSLWTKTPPHTLQRTMASVEPQPRQEWAQTIQKHILKIHFTLPLTFRINRNYCTKIPSISSFPSSLCLYNENFPVLPIYVIDLIITRLSFYYVFYDLFLKVFLENRTFQIYYYQLIFIFSTPSRYLTPMNEFR